MNSDEMSVPEVETIGDVRRRLAQLLLEKSYREGEIVLSSGKKSDYYFDCRQTALHPEGGFLIGKLLFELLKDADIKGIGGMTLGADPLVSCVSVVSFLESTQGRSRIEPLPGFLVRKEAKGHGTGKYIEGLANFSKGDRVALLEDVVTTGGTLLKVCERVKEAGLVVDSIYCILDREEGGKEACNNAGYELYPVFTKSDLLHTAQEKDKK